MTKYIIVGFTCAQVGVLLGVAIGYLLGNKKASLISMSRAFSNNLENVFIFLSLIMVTLAIFADIFLKGSGITSILIYIFGTIIFTWLLTRKSVKGEAKIQEQLLAEKAYKQLNYVEETTKEAYQQLQNYIESADEILDVKEKLVLSRAADSIKNIASGIELCKFDWEDLQKDEKPEEIKVEITKPETAKETMKAESEEIVEDEDMEEIVEDEYEDEDMEEMVEDEGIIEDKIVEEMVAEKEMKELAEDEEMEEINDIQAIEYEDKLKKKSSRRNRRKHA
ncbi:MAG: hypothetical protein PHX08_19315 [Lachnospiraceae bacterium]|nr:hypothetical protein [Lachnospiraceae bacterium]